MKFWPDPHSRYLPWHGLFFRQSFFYAQLTAKSWGPFGIVGKLFTGAQQAVKIYRKFGKLKISISKKIYQKVES
jgi:hypothetical protein